MATLTIRHAATGHSEERRLSGDRVRIGRIAQRNDVVLDSYKVSREHALLEQVGGSYRLTDLKSANGTFVNGRRISEKLLKDGDVIQISQYLLEFRADAGSASGLRFADEQLGGTVLLRSPDAITPLLTHLQQSARRDAARPTDKQIQELRKKAETLGHLYELNRMLSSVFSLEEIFKKVSELVLRVTRADRFVVLLKSPGNASLSPFLAEYGDPAAAARQEFPISNTVLRRVMTERVALLSTDARADERLALAGSIIEGRVQSVICAPLLSRGDLLGAVYLDCQQLHKLLREDDLDLVNALAAETSIAVDNAMSHDQLLKEALARAAYSRFVPGHVVEEILANPQTLDARGTNQRVTVLFSDIRGFTTLSETLAPEQVVLLLNEYFTEMTSVVFAHGGMLDKFMGDGLMALFGVPQQSEDAPARAVAAAVAMQGRMAELNRELQEAHLPEVTIGIGINTGQATVGYIGSEQHTDYTAVGDTVNLAARLEKQARPGQILISNATRALLDDRVQTRPCGSLAFKGKREPVEVFEVVV